MSMKWIKKYSFFLMILVTGMIYGTVKIVRAAGDYQDRKAQEQMAEGQTGENQDGAEDQTGDDSQNGTNPGEGSQTGDGSKPGGEGQTGDGSENGAGQTGDGSENGAGQTGDGSQNGAGQTGDGSENGAGQTGSQPGGGAQTGDGSQPGTGTQTGKQFHRVEMDYLKDALFIGDSRTSILQDYAGWEGTEYFVKNGIMIWDVWDQEIDGKTLEQRLTEKQYGKVYIMLGINELDVGTPVTYGEKFKEAVDKIRGLQPNAIIFVQAIIHVTDAKDAEGTYINNDRINPRNEELKKLADNETVFYIDANEVMDDPNTGKLNPALTGDGVHIQAKNIPLWREFLLDHGI